MLYKILRSMNLFSLGSERRRISSFAFVTLILTAEWIFIKVVKFEEYIFKFSREVTDDISQTERLKNLVQRSRSNQLQFSPLETLFICILPLFHVELLASY